MPGRNAMGTEYRYGFQGQEKDDEIKGSGNSINFKYRMHDARIGRFFALDPLAATYPHNSPYAFSENEVIDAIELEGLEKYKLNAAVGMSQGIVGAGAEWFGGSWVPFGGMEYNLKLDITFDSDNFDLTLGIEVDYTEIKAGAWAAGTGAGGEEKETKVHKAEAKIGVNTKSGEFVSDASVKSDDKFKKEESGTVCSFQLLFPVYSKIVDVCDMWKLSLPLVL